MPSTPSLNLADEPETAIAEIRANVLEHTTVATYLTKRNLKMLCLDSSGSYGGSSSDEFSSMCVVGFIFALSLSFSRPIQEISELEYLPCQYFAEYCKKNGFDGIKYISSARGFHGDVERKHFNYVLFNANDVIQKAAYKYLINNISYTITQVAEVLLKDDGEK